MRFCLDLFLLCSLPFLQTIAASTMVADAAFKASNVHGLVHVLLLSGVIDDSSYLLVGLNTFIEFLVCSKPADGTRVTEMSFGFLGPKLFFLLRCRLVSCLDLILSNRLSQTDYCDDSCSSRTTCDWLHLISAHEILDSVLCS